MYLDRVLRRLRLLRLRLDDEEEEEDEEDEDRRPRLIDRRLAALEAAERRLDVDRDRDLDVRRRFRDRDRDRVRDRREPRDRDRDLERLLDRLRLRLRLRLFSPRKRRSFRCRSLILSARYWSFASLSRLSSASFFLRSFSTFWSFLTFRMFWLH